MKTLAASDRLRSLVDFLLNFPTREQIIVYLSHNICPRGEISGVCTAELDDSGSVNFEYFYGFNYEHKEMFSVRIMDDDPASESLRSMRTHIINLHGVYEEFKDAKKLPGITEYGTGVCLPTTSRRIYIFAFHQEIHEFDQYHDYFECIRSILTFWETLNESKSIRQMPKPELLDTALTQRQERILELINAGKTNATIATQLGYSESLIRQETIIIYRKLGVDGRRELKRAIAS